MTLLFEIRIELVWVVLRFKHFWDGNNNPNDTFREKVLKRLLEYVQNIINSILTSRRGRLILGVNLKFFFCNISIYLLIFENRFVIFKLGRNLMFTFNVYTEPAFF